MKLCGIIILFNPDIDYLIKNIESIENECDKLILWQNTILDLELVKSKLNQNIDLTKIILLGDGRNLGIASALNKGIIWSIENNFTHLLTMDQDSFFDLNTLANYKIMIKALEDELEDTIGVFGINPFQDNKPLYSNTHSEYIEVNDSITSGSIFPLWVFERAGLFAEYLFIDAVDYEFCYRIKEEFNLKTIVFPGILLNHKVGYATKTIFGFKTDNYSAFRTYFIVRNHIQMWNRYPRLFTKKYKKILLLNHIFLRIVKVILAESNKLKKIKALILGAYHGLTNKTGYYNIEDSKN